MKVVVNFGEEMNKQEKNKGIIIRKTKRKDLS